MCCIVKIYLKHSTYLTMLLLQWTQLCEITWFVGYRRVFHIFVCRCRSTRSESMAFVHRRRPLLQFCRHKPRWFVALRVLVAINPCWQGYHFLEFPETCKYQGILQRLGKRHKGRKRSMLSWILDCDTLAKLLVTCKVTCLEHHITYLYFICTLIPFAYLMFRRFELTLCSCWNVKYVASRFCINRCAFVWYVVCNFVWNSRDFFLSGEW